MARMLAGWVAAVVLMAGLLAPARSAADGILCWRDAPGCPPDLYCRLHYWAPSIYRLRAYLCPRPPAPPVRHPDIPPSFVTTPYRCRAICPPANYAGGRPSERYVKETRAPQSQAAAPESKPEASAPKDNAPAPKGPQPPEKLPAPYKSGPGPDGPGD
jgi:hypothetical protein